MKVLVLSDAGAVSFYRAHGPLIENKVDILHPRIDGQLDWVDILAADAVWMTRAIIPEHVDICRQVKAVGKRLVLDYDDALFSVPVCNPNWQEHLKFPEPTKEACALADIVLFSTEGVREDFLRHVTTKNHLVVRNRAGWEISQVHNSNSRTAVWRGSPTHSRDIDQHITEIVEYCKKVGIVEFRFFGCLHDALLVHLSKAGIKVTFEPPMPIHAYMANLIKLKPHSMVIPLSKRPFNDAKSDISATEALAAGAFPAVFGDPDEFKWVGDQDSDYGLIARTAMRRDHTARRDFKDILDNLELGFYD